MTKYQKVIYKTAKLVCKNKDNKELISCYKSRLSDSKKNKHSFKRILDMYKTELKWKKWFNTYDWFWNNEKGHAESPEFFNSSSG